MKPGDRQKFVEILIGFAEIKGKELSAAGIELYWRAMRDWPIDEFITAAEHLLRTCEWFPTPKHFEDLRKASNPGPAEAWAIALDACKHWRNPERLPRGLIASAAQAVGGFRAIAMADIERDLPHVQRRFLEAYGEIGARNEITESLPQLTNALDIAPKIRHGMQPAGKALESLTGLLEGFKA